MPVVNRSLLLADFEPNVHGWRPYHAALSRARRGVRGHGARVLPRPARVRGYWIYADPRPVRATTLAASYEASAWVRSLGRRQPVCLRLREVAAHRTVGKAQRCVRAVGGWRVVSVTYAARRNGSRLGISVRAFRRFGFAVDRIQLMERASGDQSSTDSQSLRWYTPDSPFNQPIPEAAATDPNSSAMVQRLVNGAVHGFPIAAGAWTFPVYTATSSSPRYDVRLTVSWAAAHVMSGVPIPPTAMPDSAGDHHLTVMDPATNCEYDFWGASKATDGTWKALWANATMLNSDGIYAGGWSARAAGFANGLGLIRPDEVAAGRIDHALVFGFPDTKAGGPVWPATHSDGHSTVPGAIPEGARVQLDPSLNLDSLELNPWQKIVARALQTYGMFLADSGGTTSLYAVHSQSVTVPYPWGNETYPMIPTSLLSHMRVLSLRPQNPSPPAFLAPTPCATLH